MYQCFTDVNSSLFYVSSFIICVLFLPPGECVISPPSECFSPQVSVFLPRWVCYLSTGWACYFSPGWVCYFSPSECLSPPGECVISSLGECVISPLVSVLFLSWVSVLFLSGWVCLTIFCFTDPHRHTENEPINSNISTIACAESKFLIQWEIIQGCPLPEALCVHILTVYMPWSTLYDDSSLRFLIWLSETSLKLSVLLQASWINSCMICVLV